ncbi:MAG: TonB-dependent receptor [Candidatus Eremiobacteraeota bacterium]|nr:TonB-dependent receptor [Candidatus Eremiobacteraeota bacterium]
MLLAFVLCSMPSAFAQTTTGNITGTVTDSQGNTKLAGVAVSAVAPSARYSATTDQNGFFSISGVSPDTYTITFTTKGYETYSLTGVTVVQGQAASTPVALNKALQNIGRTVARSNSAAFQPSQTTDQYNVGQAGITTVLGKSSGSNEANLLASIPGASFDSSGYPVLRGGREYEEGFQYEGIDYTDAFTHQFTNSLILNGAQNFQVSPGAGDASIGNAGTGAINVVAKRGTNPHFGRLEGDIYAGRFSHELDLEYGWASPNGRYSNYSSLFANRGSFHYGGPGTDPITLGAFFTGRTYQWSNDIINNFVYKFGKDNSQSLQFFYNNTQLDIKQGIGVPPKGIPYKDNDWFFINNATAVNNGPLPFNLTNAQVQALTPFVFGQTSLTQRLGGQADLRGPQNYNQPNETFKLQYSNNLNATTFVTAKFYRVDNTALFDFPATGNGYYFSDQVSMQGGQRVGFALDGTKQLGSKNLLGFGGKFDFLRPIYSQPSASAALFAFSGYFFNNSNQGLNMYDFLPNDASCPGGPNFCGYLLGQLPGQTLGTPFRGHSLGNAFSPATGTNSGAPLPAALQLPYSDESTNTLRQDFAFYVKDTFSPTDRLKVDLGLRMDGVNWKMPTCDINWCNPTSQVGAVPNAGYQFNYDSETRQPRVIQPRFATSFQATKNDAFRFSYGRSVQFPPIASVDVSGSRTAYTPFNGIPSRDAYTGTTAQYCGVTQDQTCRDYADQLYWSNQAALGVPIAPLKPTTYNNYDFSYSHLFPHQVSVKLTPFYNKSYNQIATTQLPIVKNGVPQLDASGIPLLGPALTTNLGRSSIVGTEFLLTKEAAYGLSGSLSLTYQNAFSNVVPTSPSEDFFPTIPAASLYLGNLYRVGYLSPFVGTLALQERTRTGWRINPVLFYNHGYPIGSGLLTATTVNGVNYNVPNTNVTNSSQLNGSNGAPQYVDPRNPGTIFNPNIAARRGEAESASAGGQLSAARFAPVQLTIEYTSPKNPRSTFGAVVLNVFNQLYGQPVYNSRYQPVATGVAAPYSGYSSTATNPNYYGTFNYTLRGGNRIYTLNPSGVPRTVDFYYQLNL